MAKTDKDFSEDVYSTTDFSKLTYEESEATDAEIPVNFRNFDVKLPKPIKGKLIPTVPKRQIMPKPPSKKKPIILNNGEPLSFAVKRMVKEAVALILFFAFLTVFFVIKQMFIDSVSDDGYENLPNNSQYKTAQTIEGIASAPEVESDGYSCIKVVCNFLSMPFDEAELRSAYDGNDITNTPDGMEKELARVFKGMTVTKRANLSNYTFITQVYESLKNGMPVIISCTDTNGKSISYAVATAINPVDSGARLIRPDGTIQNIRMDNLILSTRYEGLRQADLFTRAILTFGIRNVNTAFFITKE